MNPVILRQFYENKALREAVRQFFVDNLKEIAATKAFNGETTSGIKDAHDAVEKSFDTLQQLYGKIKEPEIPNSR